MNIPYRTPNYCGTCGQPWYDSHTCVIPMTTSAPVAPPNGLTFTTGPVEWFSTLAFDLAAALDGLLDDTQHDHHSDCPEGPCPVREAREAMARWRSHYPRLIVGEPNHDL